MTAPARADPPSEGPPRGSKVERIVKHCVFEIATGAWPPGHRLPSLRAAERLWSVNHLTVARAYRRLEELGLTHSRPRSGFFVAPHASSDRMRHDRETLEALYDEMHERMLARGVRSPLGAFRYLARLAESRARKHPDCAFVECTRSQADAHAREVEERLDIPCASLTIAELADPAVRAAVRVLVTTGFHRAEVLDAIGDAAEILTVAIELAPECAADLRSGSDEMLVLAVDPDTAGHIAGDAAEVLPKDTRMSAQSCAVDAIDEVLARETSCSRRAVVLSPSLWAAADAHWRDHPAVHRLAYRIAESQWTDVAAALCVPLGVTA